MSKTLRRKDLLLADTAGKTGSQEFLGLCLMFERVAVAGREDMSCQHQARNCDGAF
jgi:hypothetical protein